MNKLYKPEISKVNAESELKELEESIYRLSTQAYNVKCNSKELLQELFLFDDESKDILATEEVKEEKRIKALIKVVLRIGDYLEESKNYINRTKEIISK